MIQLINLSFSYKEKTILENINIQFEIGHIHGIVGLNGSGKTTLFNILTGLHQQQNGTIENKSLPLKKSDIAYIDTETFFYPNLTAQEFLSVFKTTHTQFDEKGLAGLLKLPLDEFIENYSTGMKKKLLILSQIKQDKSIYIFDEPFNGLDIETNKLLLLIIEMLVRKGKTIFMSSHIIEPLYTLCYKIHHLKDKQFVKSYSKTEFDIVDQEVFGSYIENLRTSLNKFY